LDTAWAFSAALALSAVAQALASDFLVATRTRTKKSVTVGASDVSRLTAMTCADVKDRNKNVSGTHFWSNKLYHLILASETLLESPAAARLTQN
jgi:hypothetical protein